MEIRRVEECPDAHAALETFLLPWTLPLSRYSDMQGYNRTEYSKCYVAGMSCIPTVLGIVYTLKAVKFLAIIADSLPVDIEL